MSAPGPQQDSGKAAAKKISDILKSDTKANFQQNISGKVRYQKTLAGHGPPVRLV